MADGLLETVAIVLFAVYTEGRTVSATGQQVGQTNYWSL